MTTIFKFVLWLLTFAVAYFIKSTELVGLATAFFALHAATTGILLVSLLLVCAFGREVALKTYGSFLIRVLRFAVAILITSLFSFIATLLLNVDFCTAYMLTTLGQCMYNIGVVDEKDFAKFKAKLKTKKNGKQVKPNNSAVSSEKKKSSTQSNQTIADKKVQHQNASHENETFPDAFLFDDFEDVTETEGESKIVVDAVPVENVIQESASETAPEYTLDIEVDPLQSIEPNELEIQPRHPLDIPLD